MPKIGYKVPDVPNNRIIINKSQIDNVGLIDEIHHREMGHIADLVWVGRLNNSNLRQLAIIPKSKDEELTLSYEGFCVYKEKSYSNGVVFLRKDEMTMPFDGSIITMAPDTFHYFNSRGVLDPNLNYSLDVNNTSIILNNISIYNKKHTKGSMINLRASFDGAIDDENIDGNVHILYVSDDIPVIPNG
jgi:hypothetical protein